MLTDPIIHNDLKSHIPFVTLTLKSMVIVPWPIHTTFMESLTFMIWPWFWAMLSAMDFLKNSNELWSIHNFPWWPFLTFKIWNTFKVMGLFWTMHEDQLCDVSWISSEAAMCFVTATNFSWQIEKYGDFFKLIHKMHSSTMI